jgi:hypothetical protein
MGFLFSKSLLIKADNILIELPSQLSGRTDSGGGKSAPPSTIGNLTQHFS